MDLGKILREGVNKVSVQKCEVCGGEEDVRLVQVRTCFGRVLMQWLCRKCAWAEKVKVY